MRRWNMSKDNKKSKGQGKKTKTENKKQKNS